MTKPTLEELQRTVAAGPPYDRALLDLLKRDSRKGAQRLYARCVAHASGNPEQARLDAMMKFENEARAAGFSRVAGVDEAGRGPLAGPVVAGAVVLAAPLEGLDDSKRLTAARREALFEALHEDGRHDIGVGVVSAEEIDRMGIQSANYLAMGRAVEALATPPDYLLVDGYNLPGVAQPQRRLVKGDSRSASIAAASIAAKVTRDRMMVELDKRYPQYGFAGHKGYGTREHVDALACYGPCPEHRKSFAPIARPQETGLLFEGSDNRESS